jgi:ribonuclease J
MVTNTKIARDLGYLKIADENILDAYDVDDIPDEKIVVLCTGSQGEPLSALARMANGEHRSLSINANDTVIISATPVPGNEKSVQGIINSLSKIGCTIFDKSNAVVHVSGHGSREELKLMLAMTKPSFFMPVHGEAVHLRAHAQLAYDMGMPKDHVFLCDNGDTLEMRDGKVSIGQPVDSGIVYVDGLRIGDTDPVVLRDRQKLACDGIVTCVVTISNRKHKVDEVEFSSRGVSFANDDKLLGEAEALIRKSVEGGNFSNGSGTDVIRKAVRNSISNYLWNKTHTRPMVIPVVMEV